MCECCISPVWCRNTTAGKTPSPPPCGAGWKQRPFRKLANGEGRWHQAERGVGQHNFWSRQWQYRLKFWMLGRTPEAMCVALAQAT